MVRSEVKLTPRQQRFIQFLVLTTGNAAAAARMAGYSARSAKEIAYQLLKQQKVKQAATRYFKQYNIDYDYFQY